MGLPPLDFESSASTSFTTPACSEHVILIILFTVKKKALFLVKDCFFFVFYIKFTYKFSSIQSARNAQHGWAIAGRPDCEHPEFALTWSTAELLQD